jgi:hypothetical protein
LTSAGTESGMGWVEIGTGAGRTERGGSTMDWLPCLLGWNEPTCTPPPGVWEVVEQFPTVEAVQLCT